MANPGQKMAPIAPGPDGQFTIGQMQLHAQLDPQKPATLGVESGSSQLFINAWPGQIYGQPVAPADTPGTLLAEKQQEKVTITLTRNQLPRP